MHLHTSLVGKHFLVASWYKTLMISKVYIAKLLYGDQPYRISIQFQCIFICFIAYVHSGTYAIRQWSKKFVFVAIKYFISVRFLGIRLLTKLKYQRQIFSSWYLQIARSKFSFQTALNALKENKLELAICHIRMNFTEFYTPTKYMTH